MSSVVVGQQLNWLMYKLFSLIVENRANYSNKFTNNQQNHHGNLRLLYSHK